MATSEFTRAYEQFKPRKATVIATSGGTVRVRLHKDDAEPIRYFRSVVSNTPIGNTGVLLKVNKEETLFIPGEIALASATHNHDSVYAPIVHTHDSRYYTETEVNALLAARKPFGGQNSGAVAIAANSAGDYTVAAASVTLTGLTPGASYWLQWTPTLRLTGAASTSGAVGAAVTSSTGTVYAITQTTSIPAGGNLYTFTFGGNYTATAGGTLTVVPNFRWALGTVTINWAALVVSAELNG